MGDILIHSGDVIDVPSGRLVEQVRQFTVLFRICVYNYRDGAKIMLGGAALELKFVVVVSKRAMSKNMELR